MENMQIDLQGTSNNKIEKHKINISQNWKQFQNKTKTLNNATEL